MFAAGWLKERGTRAVAVLCVPREGLEKTLREGFTTCGCQVRGLSFGKACVDGVYNGKRAFVLTLQVWETIALDYTMETGLQSHPNLGEGIYPCETRCLIHVLQGKTLPVGWERKATRSSGAEPSHGTLPAPRMIFLTPGGTLTAAEEQLWRRRFRPGATLWNWAVQSLFSRKVSVYSIS